MLICMTGVDKMLCDSERKKCLVYYIIVKANRNACSTFIVFMPNMTLDKVMRPVQKFLYCHFPIF